MIVNILIIRLNVQKKQLSPLKDIIIKDFCGSSTFVTPP